MKLHRISFLVATLMICWLLAELVKAGGNKQDLYLSTHHHMVNRGAVKTLTTEALGKPELVWMEVNLEQIEPDTLYCVYVKISATFLDHKHLN